MKFLKNPYVTGALLVVGVLVVINLFRPQIQKVPVVGKLITG